MVDDFQHRQGLIVTMKKDTDHGKSLASTPSCALGWSFMQYVWENILLFKDCAQQVGHQGTKKSLP
jgi:hypothetical protein